MARKVLNDLRSVEELLAYRRELDQEARDINSEYAGLPLPVDAAERFATAIEDRKEIDRRVGELEARAKLVEQLDSQGKNEPAEPKWMTEARGDKTPMSERDIYDFATLPAYPGRPDLAAQALRDRALRAVEIADFPHPSANKQRIQTHLDGLLRNVEDEAMSARAREVALRILKTGNPTYRRAFAKTLVGGPLTTAEQNAMAEARAIGVGSTGFPVVFNLDPTLVPISNFAVNPWRALARTVTIAGTNEWRATTSAGTTAAYVAEGTEAASDAAPTLAQPAIITERAQSYMIFSIEAQEDWAAIQTELAGDLQDAKDVLEAGSFATGAGHGSNAPQGILTGATNTTVTTTTGAFVVADTFKIFEALPARYRPNAQFAANLFIIDKVRQFDTAGGSGVWIGPTGLQVAADAGAAGTVTSALRIPLLGRGLYEATAMAATLTTGTKILLVGDFRYFVIVDRIGMNIEVDPMVLGSNRRPTGQRALFAYWRNSSGVLSAAAFQTLVT